MSTETSQQPVLLELEAELIGETLDCISGQLPCWSTHSCQPWGVKVDSMLHTSGDCKWTFRQNQSVITALKRENKELKAALVSLTPAASSRQVSVMLSHEQAQTVIVAIAQLCTQHAGSHSGRAAQLEHTG